MRKLLVGLVIIISAVVVLYILSSKQRLLLGVSGQATVASENKCTDVKKLNLKIKIADSHDNPKLVLNDPCLPKDLKSKIQKLTDYNSKFQPAYNEYEKENCDSLPNRNSNFCKNVTEQFNKEWPLDERQLMWDNLSDAIHNFLRSDL